MPELLIPRVGVGIICLHPIHGIPWLRRNGTSHGNGQWSLPGGRLEFNELLANAASRELLEEFGIDVAAEDLTQIGFVSEDFFPEEIMHWITHYFYTPITDMPRLMEPDKADAIIWTPPRSKTVVVPEPVFYGAAGAIDWLNKHVW